MLISNLYVSIVTGFVTSNVLIVIIPSDLKLFISKPIYLIFIYVFIYCIFIIIIIIIFLDCYNFYSNCKYIKLNLY